MGVIKQFPFFYELGLKIKHNYYSAKAIKAFDFYQRNNNKYLLQLGAGQNILEGYFNTDYFQRNNVHFLDCTKKLAFKDQQFDFVFSEHHIEHIQYKEAEFMLREIYRVMKTGGVLRICTPDLRKYMEAYFTEKPLQDPHIKHTLENWIKKGFYNARHFSPTEGGDNVSFFVNDIFLNYEHKFIYDFETLCHLMQGVGFKNIYRVTPNESQHQELNSIESHTSEFEKPFTLAIEAIK